MTTLPRDNLNRGDYLTHDKDWNPLAKLVRGFVGSSARAGFIDGPTGIATRGQFANVRIRPLVVTALLGGGLYRVNVGEFKEGLDTTGTYDFSTDVDFSYAYPATLCNGPESGINSHFIDVGDETIGWFTGAYDDDGFEKYHGVYNRAIRFVRFNETTSCLEISYAQHATVDDVADDEWVCVIQFDPCPTDTPAASTAIPTSSDLFFTNIMETVIAGAAAPENAEALWLIADNLDKMRIMMANPTAA